MSFCGKISQTGCQHFNFLTNQVFFFLNFQKLAQQLEAASGKKADAEAAKLQVGSGINSGIMDFNCFLFIMSPKLLLRDGID